MVSKENGKKGGLVHVRVFASVLFLKIRSRGKILLNAHINYMILLCLHNYNLSYDNYLICFTEDINKIGQDKVKYNI